MTKSQRLVLYRTNIEKESERRTNERKIDLWIGLLAIVILTLIILVGN